MRRSVSCFQAKNQRNRCKRKQDSRTNDNFLSLMDKYFSMLLPSQIKCLLLDLMTRAYDECTRTSIVFDGQFFVHSYSFDIIEFSRKQRDCFYKNFKTTKSGEGLNLSRSIYCRWLLQLRQQTMHLINIIVFLVQFHFSGDK